VREVRAQNKGLQSFEAEEQALGYNHSQIGAVLAEQWKLPHRLSEAITFHHHPQLSESETVVSYIVHIANHLAKHAFYDEDDEDRIAAGQLDPRVIEYMQVADGELDNLTDALREEYMKAETFMKMAGLS
jgi:HD-like signal output (HDOD) protein